jgi:hypothetical protein
VPSLSNTADTILYLYYDKNHVDNTARVGPDASAVAQNVWSNGFVLVHHLTESGSGAAGEYKDSTKNKHNGTGGNGTTSAVPAKAAGLIGDSQSFNGKNSFYQIPNSNDLSVTNTGQLTVSFWVCPDSLIQNPGGDYVHFIGKPLPYEWTFRLYNYPDYTNPPRPQSFSLYINNPDGAGGGAGSRWDHPLIQPGTWIFITGRFGRVEGSSDITIFGNGDIASSDSYASYNIDPQYTSSDLRVGGRGMSWDGDLNGRLDEFRISSVARTSAWIKTDYFVQNDDLIEFEIPINHAPSFKLIGDKSVYPGQLLSFTISAFDPDNDPLTYKVSKLPSGANFDPSTGTFSWTPDISQIGIYTDVIFTASDGKLDDLEKLSIIVINSGTQYQISKEDVSVRWLTVFSIIGVILALLICTIIYINRHND